MSRSSLGVANRGIKDSKNRRSTYSQQPQVQYDTSLLDQVPQQPATTGTGRFAVRNKIPTSTRNASMVGAPKPKPRVPNSLAQYQPKGPSNVRPTQVPTGRSTTSRQQRQQQPIDEDDPYSSEQTEDFKFGPPMKNPIQANYGDVQTAVSLQQQTSKKQSRQPVTPLVRSVSRALMKPVQRQEDPEEPFENGVITYTVNSSLDPRRKSVTDAFIKYVEDLDEVSFLTIAKVITEFLKKSSQQQQHAEQKVAPDNDAITEDQFDQGSDEYQNYEQVDDQEEMFETE